VLQKVNKEVIFPEVMEMLDHPNIAEHDNSKGQMTRMGLVHGGMNSLIMYGSKQGHTLLRHDGVSLQYKTLKTDPKKDNFVTTEDGVVKFHMNSLHKVSPGGKKTSKENQKDALVLDISERNPLLAKVLIKYEPICREIHGNGKAYIFFKYQHAKDWGEAPIKANAQSLRASRLYGIAVKEGRILAGVMDRDMASDAGGLNRARHAACAEKTLSRDEIEYRAEGMGHSAGRLDRGTESYAKDLNDDE
jgi:hypothetical protein